MAGDALGTPGFVYGVIHPSFPGYVKIGKARNTIKRLTSYQTGDPHRRYVLAWTIKSRDYDLAERLAHTRLKGFRVANTEWFTGHPDDLFNLIHDCILEDDHD